jgi:MFS transporter, YNFM family, putative membrane transport protein
MSPDRRTLAVMLAGFCAFVDMYATQPILPVLAGYFHASQVAVSLTVTMCTLGVVLGAPFIGSIADRFGRKPVIVPATFLLAVPTLLAATSGSLGQLIFWRFLEGVLTPGIFAVTVAYIHDEWDQGTGAAMAAYVSGTVVGGFCGRMLAGVVTAQAGWRWAFVALGVLNLLCAFAIRAWLPPGKPIDQPTHRPHAARVMLGHLRNRQLLATCVVGFCVLFSLVAIFTYINFRLAGPPFHLGPAALGGIFAVYLVGAVVTPSAGRGIDRFGSRYALAAATALGSLGALLTLVPVLGVVIAGLAACCTAVFISQSAASSYIGKAAAGDLASAVGLYATFYYAGGSAGAALPGFFWARGGWPACVALVVGIQLLTSTLALTVWRD